MAEMARNDVEIMLDNVGMIYTAADGKDVQALTSVSMNIQKGEFISLLGPSGCGKQRFCELLLICFSQRPAELKLAVKLQEKLV